MKLYKQCYWAAKRWKEMERDGKRWKEMERDGKGNGWQQEHRQVHSASPPTICHARICCRVLSAALLSSRLHLWPTACRSMSWTWGRSQEQRHTKTNKDARIRSTSFKGFLVPSAASKQDLLLIPGSFFDSGCSTAAPHRETSGNLPGTALSQAPRDEEMRLHLKKHIILHIKTNKSMNKQ